MTDPALFVVNRSGRIDVMLGVHVVALIEPQGKLAHYRLLLPGCAGLRIVSSVGKARRLILYRLADWIEAAGPMFAPIAETVAAQAEMERETA